jgi:hypothetical protein
MKTAFWLEEDQILGRPLLGGRAGWWPVGVFNKPKAIKGEHGEMFTIVAPTSHSYDLGQDQGYALTI